MGNGHSALPSASQSTLLNSTLVCSCAELAGIFAVQSEFSFTSPIAAGLSQDIYYSDGDIKVTLPSFVAANGNAKGQLGLYAQLTLGIETTNASPQISILKSGAIAFLGGDQIKLEFDPNRVLEPVGPINIHGIIGETVDLRFSYLSISVQYQQPDDGSNAIPGYNFMCGSQPIEYIIASTAIDNSTGAQQPSTGVKGTFVSTVAQEKAALAHVPITCTTRFGAPEPLNDTDWYTSGKVPAALSPGQTFALKNFNHFVSISQELAIDENALNCGSASTVIEVTGGLDWTLDNAIPSAFDAGRWSSASSPGTSNPLSSVRYIYCPTADRSGELEFPLPFFGDVQYDGFVAGTANTTFRIAFKALQTALRGVGLNGRTNSEDMLSCIYPQASALFSVPITTGQLPADLQY